MLIFTGGFKVSHSPSSLELFSNQPSGRKVTLTIIGDNPNYVTTIIVHLPVGAEFVVRHKD